MIRKSIFVTALILSGCTPKPTPPENFKSLNNQQLCQALGYNSDKAVVTLSILNEISSRGESIDMDQCHALEMATREHPVDFLKTEPWDDFSRQVNKRIMEDIQKMHREGRL